MVKGITPVIALVMLMLITVGMVGMAYTWFSGLLTTQIEKGVSIPPGGAFCSAGKISVLIQNNGATSSITQDDVIIADVAGTAVTKQTVSIPPGGGALIIKDYNCGGTCAGGTTYSVRVGTRTGVVESAAYCR